MDSLCCDRTAGIYKDIDLNSVRLDAALFSVDTTKKLLLD